MGDQTVAGTTAALPAGHSGPLIRGLHEWMGARLAQHKTESNSGLRKAISSYSLNHWPKLTLFLRQPGAPIDNNIVERALKKSDSEPQERTLL
jgi:transposase